MARRVPKAEAALIIVGGVIALIGGAIWKLYAWLSQWLTDFGIVMSIAGIIILVMVARASARGFRERARARATKKLVEQLKTEEKERRDRLIKKYGDVALVEKMLQGTIWKGQSRDQLIDTLGQPTDEDITVAKDHVALLKYGAEGKNRYRVRISLRNGTVEGWKIR